MKIGENVALLSLPHPLPGSDAKIHPVLTWDEENLVLIDAGFPGQIDAIKEAIANEGFEAKNLTHLIITHQDLDHIGCMKDLSALAPNLQIMAHIEEAPHMDGRKTPAKLAAMIEKYDTLPEEHKQGIDQAKAKYQQVQVNFQKELHDKEILPLCGGIEVIHTPGHTPGHIVLFLQKSRILVCGDAANINENQLTGPNPIHTMDMEQGTQSFEHIKNFPKAGLVAYHGGYLETT